MKKLKQILAALVCFAMLVSVLPTGVVMFANAESDIKTKLDSVIASYPAGGRWIGSFDGGKECYGFAKLVIYNLFGKYNSSRYRSWTYAGVSTSGMNVVGSITSYSASNVKDLLSKAKPGDALQFDSTKQHSMIVYSVNDSSVTVYDCNWDGNCGIRLTSCSYGTWSGRNSAKLTLLRSDNYPETHTHSYVRNYEAAHPHRVYMKCSCGNWYYTDETTTVSSCSQCNVHAHSYVRYFEAAHPHRVYMKCSCGNWYYTGETTPVSSCSQCKVNVPDGVYVFHCVRNPDRVLDIQYDSKERGANIQLYNNWYNQVQKFRVVNMGDYYCIQSVYSGMWLDISYPYNEQGCNIQLWDTNTSTEQKWVFEDAGNGNVYIRSLYGMYLDTGGPTDNNTNIQTWSFDGSTSQQWKLELTSPYERKDVADGIYTFHNYRNQNRVLDIMYDSTEIRANIQLYDDLNNSVQRFRVTKVLDDTNSFYYVVQSVYSGYWLDIASPYSTSGCNVQLWQDHSSPEQKWVFEDAGNGKVLIRSLYGTYVDLQNGKTDNSTNVQMINYDGSTSMEWMMHKVYSVTYNANGGTGAPAEQAKQSDINLSLSSTKPSRSGYTFSGWNTKANGSGTSYAAGGTYVGNADVTLYAQWTVNTYAVKFDGNGATSGNMSDQTLTRDQVQNLTANAFKRAYTVMYNYNGATGDSTEANAAATAAFNGWATAATGTKAYNDKASVSNLAAAGDTCTLYANWTLGSVTLPSPTKTGYTFDGWYTDSTMTSFAGKAGASFTPTANVTLYAKWAETSLTKIAVKTLPAKTSYFVGDTLETDRLTLTAAYSDGSTKTITNDFTCIPMLLNTAGAQTITVTYEGKETTFTVAVIPSIQNNAPQMSLSHASARAGDRVNVTLSVENNPGIIATSVNLTYDTTALHLVGVENGTLFDTKSFSPGKNLDAVPYTIIWEDGLATQNHTENGILATFTFEVLADAPIGATVITLGYTSSSTFNIDLDEVGFAPASGSIEVVDRTPGDVNGDGIVDLKDVVILSRHLSGGWGVTIIETSADVNGDHLINLKDTVLLRRYLSGGWDVVLK